MLKDKMTLVINSCDKFSDLWDEHVRILNENWSDREVETLLVTDRPTDRKLKRVRIFSAGEGKEYPQRMAAVLPEIRTEYVLITLDDYFPINKIYNDRLERLIGIMDARRGLITSGCFPILIHIKNLRIIRTCMKYRSM